MNFILESLFVGLYSAVLFNVNILLLLQCEKQGKRRPKCFREQKE